jgi:hypothetical protein
MADELKSGFSVTINFAEGEILSPAKLTAITAQLKKVAEELEAAAGDIHGDSWPYTAASTTTLSPAWGREADSVAALDGGPERKLDIANIGRAIGPMSNLNPTMLSGSQSITEVVPVGVHEFSLRYPVEGIVLAVTSTDAAHVDMKLAPYLIVNSGDWAVTQAGKVFSYDATSGGTITYTTNPEKWNGGKNYSIAEFNVIPDINQLNVGNGVSLSALDVNGRRVASFPVITQQQTNVDHDSTTLGTEDMNYGQIARLPKVLVDNLTAGDEIPAGFLYLKNYTTGEVYTEGVYYYNDENSIELSDIDLVSAIAAGHKFCVITVGTDITTSIDDLRNKTRHSHDRTHGEPFVDVDGITGIHASGSATNSKVFVPSNMPGNFAPQYLHRDGWYSGNDDNANENNIMRGHLVLGPSAGGVLGSSSAASFALVFGDGTSGIADFTVPKIWRAVTDDLWLNSPTGLTVRASEDITLSGAGSTSSIIMDPGYGSIPFAMFSAEGTFTSAATNTARELTDGANTTYAGEIDSVNDKEWLSVQVWLALAGDTHYRSGNRTGYNNPDKSVLFSFDRIAGVSKLYITVGADYASQACPMKLVITYKP